MAPWRNQASKTLDMEAVRDRMMFVAETLRLDRAEVEAAMYDVDGDGQGIVQFAARYGQSLDWLLFNDVGVMVASQPLR